MKKPRQYPGQDRLRKKIPHDWVVLNYAVSNKNGIDPYRYVQFQLGAISLEKSISIFNKRLEQGYLTKNQDGWFITPAGMHAIRKRSEALRKKELAKITKRNAACAEGRWGTNK